ncbi:hypothetical protein FV222_23365, partial [Methylobacterium sp. WL103]
MSVSRFAPRLRILLLVVGAAVPPQAVLMRSALSQPGVAEANLDEISVTAETVAPAATGPGPA